MPAEMRNAKGRGGRLGGSCGTCGYKHGAPQQPAKGALLVGESPTRRIRRFTTERPGACPRRKAGGESSPGTEPTGRNEDEPHRMSLVMLNERRRRASGVLCEGCCSQESQSPSPANSVGVSVVSTSGRDEFSPRASRLPPAARRDVARSGSGAGRISGRLVTDFAWGVPAVLKARSFSRTLYMPVSVRPGCCACLRLSAWRSSNGRTRRGSRHPPRWPALPSGTRPPGPPDGRFQGSLYLGGERIEWQALGRLRAGFAPQKQCNFFGCGCVDIVPAAECGRESGNGEPGAGRQRVEEPGKSYGIPMEPLWSSYGVPMEQHAYNTPGTGGRRCYFATR
jgi:hypothetical protein